MIKKKVDVEYEDVEGEDVKGIDIDRVDEKVPMSLRLTHGEIEMVHKIRDKYGYDSVSDLLRDGIKEKFEALKNVSPVSKLINDCVEGSGFGLFYEKELNVPKLVKEIKDRKIVVLTSEDRKLLLGVVPEKKEDFIFGDKYPLKDFCSLLDVTVEDFKAGIKEGKTFRLKRFA